MIRRRCAGLESTKETKGHIAVDFTIRTDLTVVNTYFQRREEHRVTYKSGGRSIQVDYILCRQSNLGEISDCKVGVGEGVFSQHWMVVCRMTIRPGSRRDQRWRGKPRKNI